jgi:acyl-CoA thioester hydrolase
VSEWPFSHLDRVRYADLDTMRHVNNVAFVRFFESARLAFMQHAFPQHDPTDPADFPAVLAEVHVHYRAPAYLDEQIRTLLRPREVKRSSFIVQFEMRREGDGTVLADGHGVYVGYDYVAEKARPLGEEMTARLRELGAG